MSRKPLARAPVTVVVESPKLAGAPSTPSDFSAVAGRILDQLSATAWLPAAFLVGDVALALAYAMNTGSPTQRWAAIGESLDTKPFGVILGISFALVLTTIVTQSIEFLAIRFLEGYWGASRPASTVASWGIWLQERRQERLIKLGEELDRRAQRTALPSIQVHFRSLKRPEVGDYIRASLDGEPTDPFDEIIAGEAQTYLARRQWMVLAPAHLTHRISAVDQRLAAFPTPDRMMPTRLGIALRAPEDALSNAGEGNELQAFVIKNLGRIDSQLLAEHDQYRNRLDMYASLTVITSGLAAVNVAILVGAVQRNVLVALSVAMLSLSWASYRGAIAAAEDYGTVLSAIDERVPDVRQPR